MPAVVEEEQPKVSVQHRGRLAQLRRRAPTALTRVRRAFVVSRREDVRSMALDDRLFKSPRSAKSMTSWTCSLIATTLVRRAHIADQTAGGQRLPRP
jgi:hypothetical protein